MIWKDCAEADWGGDKQDKGGQIGSPFYYDEKLILQQPK